MNFWIVVLIIFIILVLLAAISLLIWWLVSGTKCDKGKKACGKQCYDPTNQQCKDGKIIDLLRCGNQLYDKSMMKCCDNRLVIPKDKDCPPMDEFECYSMFMEYDEGEKKINEKFVNCTELGVQPDNYMYDNNQIKSNTNYYMVREGDKIVRRNTPLENPEWFMYKDNLDIGLVEKDGRCVNFSGKPTLQDCKWGVCGNQVYNNEINQCCNGQVVDKKLICCPAGQQVCASQCFDPTKFKCQDDKLNPI